MSSTAPLIGRLSQIFSPRHCILLTSILFALGGLLTSRAHSFASFIAGRVVSGVGGAGVLTLSLILVLELSTKKSRGLFIGLVNAGYTSGVSLGALVAGAVVPRFGWRVAFTGQVPLALAAGVIVFLSLPSHFHGGSGKGDAGLYEKAKRVDYTGALLLTSTLVLFLYGISSPKIQYLPILLSLPLLPLFVAHELYFATEPLIPIALLKSRAVLLACLAQLGFMSVRWTVLFFTPIYALSVLFLSPARAGSVLIPTNLGFALGGLLAGALHIKRSGSFYLASVLSFLAFAGSIAALAWLVQRDLGGWLALTAVVFACGLATGAGINYTLAHVLHLTSPSTHFMASSLLATFRGFAGSFGSSVGGGYFIRVLRTQLERRLGGYAGSEEMIERLLGSPEAVGGLPWEYQGLARRAYVDALAGLWWVAAGVALFCCLLQAGTGWTAAEEEAAEVAEAGDDEEGRP
jgi:predicted MFS family arabinose efflux permease